MSQAELNPVLIGGVAICAVMAVVSSLRFKSRGVSAYIMAFAFAVLGGAMLLVYFQAPMPIILLSIIILILLLAADFAARAAHGAKKGRP